MYNRKKINLLPLTPNKIVQCDRAIAEIARQKSEIQHASPVKLEQRAPSLSSNAIKLKSRAMLIIKSDIVVSTNVDISFHALVCRQVLFSLEDITTPCHTLSLTFCISLRMFLVLRYPGAVTFERN
jgi:hypothetical protein